MRKFIVNCTKIYNGSMKVEANNETEAIQIAQEKLNNDVNCIDWELGEGTADYVDTEAYTGE